MGHLRRLSIFQRGMGNLVKILGKSLAFPPLEHRMDDTENLLSTINLKKCQQPARCHMRNYLIIDEQIGQPTALWLEHEGNDFRTDRNGRVQDLLDDASGKRVVCIFGPGFAEELPRAATRDICALNNNVRHSDLIR